MKNIKELSAKFLKELNEPKLTHFQAVLGTWKPIEPPRWSTELSCEICGCKSCFWTIVKPHHDDRGVWICANNMCPTVTPQNVDETEKSIKYLYDPDIKRQDVKEKKRAISWKDFCKESDLGDIHYEVKFEKIEQPESMKTFLLKFVQGPKGIVLMTGKAGSGKTYTALAVCEYYTRENRSCIFISQRELFNQWLEIARGETTSYLLKNIESVGLLVVDDFGTSEPSPAFMAYFMELINKRIQWKDKATMITTNLDDKKMSEYCGEALGDRIATGNILIFKGASRRKQVIV